MGNHSPRSPAEGGDAFDGREILEFAGQRLQFLGELHLPGTVAWGNSLRLDEALAAKPVESLADLLHRPGDQEVRDCIPVERNGPSGRR